MQTALISHYHTAQPRVSSSIDNVVAGSSMMATPSMESRGGYAVIGVLVGAVAGAIFFPVGGAVGVVAAAVAGGAIGAVAYGIKKGEGTLSARVLEYAAEARYRNVNKVGQYVALRLSRERGRSRLEGLTYAKREKNAKNGSRGAYQSGVSKLEGLTYSKRLIKSQNGSRGDYQRVVSSAYVRSSPYKRTASRNGSSRPGNSGKRATKGKATGKSK